MPDLLSDSGMRPVSGRRSFAMPYGEPAHSTGVAIVLVASVEVKPWGPARRRRTRWRLLKVDDSGPCSARDVRNRLATCPQAFRKLQNAFRRPAGEPLTCSFGVFLRVPQGRGRVGIPVEIRPRGPQRPSRAVFHSLLLPRIVNWLRSGGASPTCPRSTTRPLRGRDTVPGARAQCSISSRSS